MEYNEEIIAELKALREEVAQLRAAEKKRAEQANGQWAKHRNQKMRQKHGANDKQE